jgi:gamma-glutamyltranspeptidase/glutathione hydrolase
MGVVDYGMNIQEAVNAARFHQQWLPDKIMLEMYGVSPDTLQILEKMGHKLKTDREFWGDAECIAIDEKTGERLGASDGRNNGKAAGY